VDQAALFARGKKLLGKTAGGLIVKAIRQLGEERFAAFLDEADKAAFVSPRDYLGALMKAPPATQISTAAPMDRSLESKAWFVARGIHSTTLHVSQDDYSRMTAAGLVTEEQARWHGWAYVPSPAGRLTLAAGEYALPGDSGAAQR